MKGNGELGQRLTVIRCLAHMDRAEAARLSHVRSERLQAFEDGDEEPLGSDLLGLADAYGVSMDFLIDTSSDTDPRQRAMAASYRRAKRVAVETAVSGV